MNIKELKQSDRIIYEAIGGSWAYGTNTPKSDKDVRGIYLNPKHDYLGLREPSKQINDDKNDIVYYSLKRFFELIQSANPNLIEMLWYPEDCIIYKSRIMEVLFSNRNLFISKKAFFTHIKYAESQIKKARGSNKKVHNPQPKEQPKKEDFCWVVTKDDMLEMDAGVDYNGNNIFPIRPVSLIDAVDGEPIYDLKNYHVSALEHTSHIYRLYYYGDMAKGVFRGDDMLVCESIPKEDEHLKFSGLLIYNKDSYEKAIRDHKSYWDWMKNRNESRWIDQEKGKLNYDQKNLCHCMRLLMSGENILVNGYPIVRFEGEQLEYLMDIRAGNLEYEDLMAEVENRMSRLEDLYKTSTIPHKVNVKKIEEFYRELTND